MNRRWQKPELVVLFRINSNEVVLGNCKVAYALGPIVAATGCQNVGGSGACRGYDPKSGS